MNKSGGVLLGVAGAGVLAFLLMKGGTYKAGDVLFITGPGEPGGYITVMSVGDDHICFAEGWYPNVLGTSCVSKDAFYQTIRTQTEWKIKVVAHVSVPEMGLAADPALVSPDYLKGYRFEPTYTWSTDDIGGTEGSWVGPIGQAPPIHPIPRTEGPSRRGGEIEGWGQNYPYYTGGTFLHPEYLPPVRKTQLQGAVQLI